MSLLQEHDDVPAPLQPPDCIGLAVGGRHFIRGHRTELHLRHRGGHLSPRLTVSRFYWDLEPPVAVDFARDLRHGEAEALAKKDYFKDRDAIYIVVRDEWDGEGAEAALFNLAPQVAETIRQGNQPVTGPRRRR